MTAIDNCIANLQAFRQSGNTEHAKINIGLLVQALEEIQAGLSPAGPETANTFYAGPTSGAPDTPAFRGLVSADMGNFTQSPTFQQVTVNGNGNIGVNNRSMIQSPADGGLLLTNRAGTGFTELQFGGMSAAFPALARLGTGLVAQLADGSAFAPFAAGAITINGTAAAQLHALTVDGTTIAGSFGSFANTGAQLVFGIEDSVGGTLFSGGSSYASGIGSATNTPLQFATNNIVRGQFGPDGSFLVGTEVNGGWPGNAKVAFQNSTTNGKVLSLYSAGTGLDILDIRTDNTASNLATFRFNGATAVGSITTNGTITSYNVTSTEQVKKDIAPLDSALAMNMVRAYAGYTYTAKKTGVTEHGFIVERFVAAAKKLGIDAHKLGLAHIPAPSKKKDPPLPGMDYSKATPFLARAAIDQADELADLRQEVKELRALVGGKPKRGSP